MGKTPTTASSCTTLNGHPSASATSCGASAHQKLPPDHPLQGREPVIVSISSQIYRRVSGAGHVQVATPSFQFCDSCLQKALVIRLFSSRVKKGQTSSNPSETALYGVIKTLLEEQGS